MKYEEFFWRQSSKGFSQKESKATRLGILDLCLSFSFLVFQMRLMSEAVYLNYEINMQLNTKIAATETITPFEWVFQHSRNEVDGNHQTSYF